MPTREARATDIYSFALLGWRVLLDGASPFRHIDELDTLHTVADIDALVQELKVLNAVGDMMTRDVEEACGPWFAKGMRLFLEPNPRRRELNVAGLGESMGFKPLTT